MATAAQPVPPAEKKTPHLTLYSSVEALSILDDLIAEYGQLIEANGGDIESVPEIAELLSFAEDGFEAAVERWALKIRSLLAEVEAVKLERQRLETIERQKANAAVRLKDYLRRHMEARGRSKIATPLVTARIQKNGGNPTVKAISESTIEELFANGSKFAGQRIEYVLEVPTILDAVKNGEELPAGIVVQRGNHLRVE